SERCKETDKETLGGVSHYDYIMGNPPFVGARLMSKEQKADLAAIFGPRWKNLGNMDYVCGWYKKAADLMAANPATRTALVSTNSITQGEQVANLWRPLVEQQGVVIDFAYRTFRWDSESNSKAHVHCVIIGFHCGTADAPRLFDGAAAIPARHINAYLMDAPDVWIEKRMHPLSDVPEICLGGQPIDDGNFLLTQDEMESLLKSEPQAEPLIRPFMMGKDFIERKPRFCLWLKGADISLIRKCPKVMERIKKVRDFRLQSNRDNTLKAAETPTLFGAPFECESQYVAIPKVSSENRRYIPIDYLPANIIPGDKLFCMQNATLYHFGVLTSSVHMAWMRATCGRLKSDYSYSNTIVYNNFPWPKEAKIVSSPKEYIHGEVGNFASLPSATSPNKEAKIISSPKEYIHGEVENYAKEAKIVSSPKESTSGEVKNFASLPTGEVGNFASLDAPSPYLDKNQDINEHRAHLPHWHQDGKLQFITFRLADSLPKEKLDELKSDKAKFLEQHPEPWDKETEAKYYAQFGSKIDEWLDAGMGSCILQFPNIREIVCHALEFYNGERYLLHSYVVMPNHVHVLVEMLGEYKTGDVLHTWKRYTSNQINKLIGGSGRLWQHESYDRLIRDKSHYSNVLGYISGNPKYLPVGSYTLLKEAKIASSPKEYMHGEVENYAKEAKIVSSPEEYMHGEVGNYAKEAKIASSPKEYIHGEVENFASLPSASSPNKEAKIVSSPKEYIHGEVENFASLPNASSPTKEAKIASSPKEYIHGEVGNFASLAAGEVENFASLIEQTAQSILDARALYPDSSLADLYDELTMPPELRRAHQANDRAVMQAYGFPDNISESECVAELFKMYNALTSR
ncbi:MAG: transposase, partial [Bacteroidales bacterium]|nr:transposase [Bacteroidales bacterium]